jgi:hypothetical protein
MAREDLPASKRTRGGWVDASMVEKMRTSKIPAIDADGLLVFVFGFLVG